MSDKCDNKLIVYANREDIVKFQKNTKAVVGELWFGKFNLWRIQQEGEGTFFEFQTSWQPPISWLKCISNKFPNTLFKLEFESFAQYEGVAYARNGKISICRDGDVFPKVTNF